MMDTNGRPNGQFSQMDNVEGTGGRRRKEAETLLVQEVEELRGRAVQMEKTMRFAGYAKIKTNILYFRWWSDCAANWREKWTRVRLERNKAMEEARDMKSEAARIEKERERVRYELWKY